MIHFHRRVLLLAVLAVLPLSSGCSWLTDLVLINTLDRDQCDTSELGKDERIRIYEEKFLRERDWEAQRELYGWD